MPAPSEQQIQAALWRWFAGERYPKNHPRAGQWQIEPAKRDDVIGWHTPNSGEGRNAEQGKRLKEAGVVAGIFDLTFLHRSRLFVLELKDGDGTLSDSQKKMWPRYVAAGAAGIAWANSLEGAKHQIRTWGLVRIGC